VPQKMTVDEQFEKWTYRDPIGGCWIWLGHLCADGYGKAQNRAYPRQSLAHRLAYVHYVGEIPADRELDHRCRNRCCVNPAHLEAVTHEENIKRGVYSTKTHRNARKTHCIRGHEFSGVNVYIETYAGVTMRKCRQCRALRQRLRNERIKRGAEKAE
jgi:hypothetical protein